MSPSLLRPDIFNVVEYLCNWDLRMRDCGFDSGWLYKKFLLDFGKINSDLESRYDFLTIEGWKETLSERVEWGNLPSRFDWKRLPLPYRSPFLENVHNKISSLEGVCDSADIRSEQWRLTFPYQALIDQCRMDQLDADVLFRSELASCADSSLLISAANSVGVNPIGVPVGIREVKRVVHEFCRRNSLATLSSVRPTKSGFVYGHEFDNDLVLCLSILEVRSLKVGNDVRFRINHSFNLVCKDQFRISWGWPKDFPWAGLPELSLYPSYGLKDSSPAAFYVNLAYILLSFRFWCEAFDRFFGLKVEVSSK